MLLSPVTEGCQHPAHAGHAGGQGEQDALPSSLGEHVQRRVRVREGLVRQGASCAAYRVFDANRGRARDVCRCCHADAVPIIMRQP